MGSRREFLSAGGGPALTHAGQLPLDGPTGAGAMHAGADDEDYWLEVRAAFALDPSIVNLDHGWTSPAPREAVDTLNRYATRLEASPSRQLSEIWTSVTDTSVRSALATVMGVPAGEIALVRNATEALNTVLLGIPMERGDEILCSSHDYYAMLAAIEQRRRRDGIVVRKVRPPVPATSPDELVRLYREAMGPRTRLVLLTHPSNRSGQLLPIDEITQAARAVGAQVVVDGAQSLGLTNESVAVSGCDYYGASAHKWLGVPVGIGLLWMKPEHCGEVWPLWPPDDDMASNGMGRYEWVGTTTDFIGPSALPALALHHRIGADCKGARLRYLHRYLRDALRDALPGSRFLTDGGAWSTLSISTLSLPAVDVSALEVSLYRKHHVLVQAFAAAPDTPDVNGIRITPNVFSSLRELDRLVSALREELR